MKKKLFALMTVAVLLAGCSGDDNDNQGRTVNTNVNANDASTMPEYARLEFPHLKGGAENRVLIHRTNDSYGVNYCVEWDDSKKSQRWSCYQLYKSNLAQNTTRYTSQTNQYPQDDLIPSAYRFTTDPFRNTGYDHGHICPSADRLYSAEANYQTFFLSNMQPQVHDFNAGVWENMESAVRRWATQQSYGFADTLYVCKGGTIDDDTNIIERRSSGLIVPKYYWMAVLRVKNGQYNAMAFWVEHKANNDEDLAKYALSIDELEAKTGIDFFCNLPDDREATIEKTLNTGLWGLK